MIFCGVKFAKNEHKYWFILPSLIIFQILYGKLLYFLVGTERLGLAVSSAFGFAGANLLQVEHDKTYYYIWAPLISIALMLVTRNINTQSHEKHEAKSST